MLSEEESDGKRGRWVEIERLNRRDEGVVMLCAYVCICSMSFGEVIAVIVVVTVRESGVEREIEF